MNMFATDSYFHIGEQHLRVGLPCEDYALSGASDEVVYAVVSDGCSSGGMTDVGARVLVHTTARALESEAWRMPATVPRTYLREAQARTELMFGAGRELLGLTVGDMLATSLIAVLSPYGGVAQMFGDGVLARVYRSGESVLSSFSWENNMPFYPAYRGETLRGFLGAHGNDLTAVRLYEERVTICEGVRSVERIPHTLLEGVEGVYVEWGAEEVDALAYVGLFSDGVTQVERVDWVDVVLRFLAYRSHTGAFLKRRMIRGLKDYGVEGARAMDDVSGAVIARLQT